ncbi:MAG TPA: SatD family protein [Feifaniaceae bacterium]|nr:SatD family protein [Feifaniaceae bacterium]
MKNYVAVIMDLRASKKMKPEERQRCQEKLGRVLALVNDIYGSYMVSKAEFSAGDSIQTLFTELDEALNFMFCVQKFMYPFQLDAGLGIGDLYVHVENEGSNAQDGPCYHYARKALESCGSVARAACLSEDETSMKFLNNLLFVLYALQYDQTKKQRDLNNLLDITYPIADIEYEHAAYADNIHLYIKENITTYNIQGISDLTDKSVLLEWGQNGQKIGTNWASLASKLLGTTYENIRQMIAAGNLQLIRLQKLMCLTFVLQYLPKEEG